MVYTSPTMNYVGSAIDAVQAASSNPKQKGANTCFDGTSGPNGYSTGAYQIDK